MAEGKKSFTAYCDWKETFNTLPDDKAGQLIKHLMSYVNDENPETDDILIKAVFAQMKATLKRDLKKWEGKREQNKANALKRWNKKDAIECERIKSDANDAVSVSVRVSDSVSDINKQQQNGKFDVAVLPEEKEISEILQDYKKQIGTEAHESWRETFYMKLRINKGSLSKIADEFILDFSLREHKKPKSVGEFKTHLLNWCNVQDRLNKLDKYKIKSSKNLAI